MASVYEKPPIFCKERLWVEKDLKSLEKRKFQENHMKAEVYTYGGDLGMEFLLSKTIPDFMSAGNRLNWTWPQSFEEFGNVLDGSPKTVWEESYIASHFSIAISKQASTSASSISSRNR